MGSVGMGRSGVMRLVRIRIWGLRQRNMPGTRMH